MNAPYYPIVLLKVDSYDFFAKMLAPERRVDVPKKINDFTDAVRPFGILTIHIVTTDRKKQQYFFGAENWDHSTASPRPAAMLDSAPKQFALTRSELGELVQAHADEDIFAKDCYGAFSNQRDEPNHTKTNILAKQLETYGTHTVLIAGMHSRLCVLDTINGARKNGFNCDVITDLLADYKALKDQDQDPCWHEKMLRNNVDIEKGMRYFSSAEYLDNLAAAPCKPESAVRSLTPAPLVLT